MSDRDTHPSIAAIIGGGVIGGGWAARFLLNGWDVRLYDPHPEAEKRIAEVLDNARRSLPALADFPMPAEGELTLTASVAEAVTGSDWIQESVPEDLALKHGVIALVNEELPSVFIAPDDLVFEKNVSNIEEVRARKGPMITVTTAIVLIP